MRSTLMTPSRCRLFFDCTHYTRRIWTHRFVLLPVLDSRTVVVVVVLVVLVVLVVVLVVVVDARTLYQTRTVGRPVGSPDLDSTQEWTRSCPSREASLSRVSLRVKNVTRTKVENVLYKWYIQVYI